MNESEYVRLVKVEADLLAENSRLRDLVIVLAAQEISAATDFATVRGAHVRQARATIKAKS